MPCRIYKLDFQENTWPVYFKCLHVKNGKRLVFIISRGTFDHGVGTWIAQLVRVPG